MAIIRRYQNFIYQSYERLLAPQKPNQNFLFFFLLYDKATSGVPKIREKRAKIKRKYSHKFGLFVNELTTT